jgi:hypothetical protein
MYLAALHVARPSTELDGFNAFHYAHEDGDTWHTGPPDLVPDQDPGELVKSVITVAPGGNRVRSYLDIVGRDDASWHEIRGNFLHFVLDSEGQRFPWRLPRGGFLFRAAIEDALASDWRDELGRLFEAARSVRPGP